MKKLTLILIAGLISCQKEDIKISSSTVDNLTENIVFSPNILPKKRLLDAGVFRSLIGDTFSSPSCTISGVTMRVANMGGNTEKCKLHIDNLLVDTVSYPEIDEFGRLLFNFSPDHSIISGDHLLEVKGLSSGPDSLNVIFSIIEMSTVENIPVEGLYITKLRWYKN